MSAKSGFLVVIGWLLIIGAGLFAVIAMACPQATTDMTNGFIGMQTLPFWRWTIILAGVLLVALALVLPFTGHRGRKSGKPIEFTSEVGSMIIEASALEDCLRRTALENEDVTDASASIKVPEIGQDQPIICSVRIGIRERPDIPGKGSVIARQIRDRFLEILPMDTPPIVNLDRISIQRPKPVVTRTFTDTGAEPTLATADDLPEIAVTSDSEPIEGKVGFTGVMQYPVEKEGNSDTEDDAKPDRTT